jgi:hypothetical protein
MKKGRLLVYSYYFYPHENANTNYVTPILLELCKTYDLDVFTCDLKKNLQEVEQYHGITLLRFRQTEFEKLIKRTFGVYDKNMEDLKQPFYLVKRLLWRLLHMFSRRQLARLLPEYPVRKALVNCLRKRPYLALITFSAPIEPQRDTLALAQKDMLGNVPWFAYFMDPHATFIGFAQDYATHMKKEMEIYMTADAVFLTPALYQDNISHPLSVYRNKMIPVAYANIRPLQSGARPGYLDTDKIICTYTGSLFSHTVRNPEYFFQLIQTCDERFQFHIVCYDIDGRNRLLKERYVDDNPNVIWHGRMTMDECINLMCWSNILINLGNRCTNQMPSKVFDYMSAGKPIVNIHPLQNDTARPYLDKYPLVVNIPEKTPFDPADTQRFTDFCTAHQQDTVSFAHVQKQFASQTPAKAAEKLEREIEKQRQRKQSGAG